MKFSSYAIFLIQQQNYALKEHKEENKVLFWNLNLNYVLDPNVWAYIKLNKYNFINQNVDPQDKQTHIFCVNKPYFTVLKKSLQNY